MKVRANLPDFSFPTISSGRSFFTLFFLTRSCFCGIMLRVFALRRVERSPYFQGVGSALENVAKAEREFSSGWRHLRPSFFGLTTEVGTSSRRVKGSTDVVHSIRSYKFQQPSCLAYGPFPYRAV